jgi:hypothetical protein
VHQRRLADDVLDAHARIEGGERILEDHLHLEADPLLAAVAKRASARGQDAGDHAAKRGLAAARFAHQADHFAFVHAERDVVHRVHHFVGDVRAQSARDLSRHIERLHEALGDVLQLEQGLHGCKG